MARVCQLQSSETNDMCLTAGIRHRSLCTEPVSTLPYSGQIIVYSTSEHTTIWWSDHRVLQQWTHYHMVVRSSCIPPVNRVFHQWTHYHMVVRSSCIAPVNTLPYDGQIIVLSTSQHSTTWWSDHRAFHQWTHYHMVVRSSCIPPMNTVPHSGQIIVYCTSEHTTIWWSDHRVFHHCIVYSTSEHTTIWWSDHRAFHHSTQCNTEVRSKDCEAPTN